MHNVCTLSHAIKSASLFLVDFSAAKTKSLVVAILIEVDLSTLQGFLGQDQLAILVHLFEVADCSEVLLSEELIFFVNLDLILDPF